MLKICAAYLCGARHTSVKQCAANVFNACLQQVCFFPVQNVHYHLRSMNQGPSRSVSVVNCERSIGLLDYVFLLIITDATFHYFCSVFYTSDGIAVIHWSHLRSKWGKSGG